MSTLISKKQSFRRHGMYATLRLFSFRFACVWCKYEVHELREGQQAGFPVVQKVSTALRSGLDGSSRLQLHPLQVHCHPQQCAILPTTCASFNSMITIMAPECTVLTLTTVRTAPLVRVGPNKTTSYASIEPEPLYFKAEAKTVWRARYLTLDLLASL